MLETIERIFKYLTIISIIVTGMCLILGVFFPLIGLGFTVRSFLVSVIFHLMHKIIKKKLAR